MVIDRQSEADWSLKALSFQQLLGLVVSEIAKCISPELADKVNDDGFQNEADPACRNIRRTAGQRPGVAGQVLSGFASGVYRYDCGLGQLAAAGQNFGRLSVEIMRSPEVPDTSRPRGSHAPSLLISEAMKQGCWAYQYPIPSHPTYTPPGRAQEWLD